MKTKKSTKIKTLAEEILDMVKEDNSKPIKSKHEDLYNIIKKDIAFFIMDASTKDDNNDNYDPKPERKVIADVLGLMGREKELCHLMAALMVYETFKDTTFPADYYPIPDRLNKSRLKMEIDEYLNEYYERAAPFMTTRNE